MLLVIVVRVSRLSSFQKYLASYVQLLIVVIVVLFSTRPLPAVPLPAHLVHLAARYHLHLSVQNLGHVHVQ